MQFRMAIEQQGNVSLRSGRTIVTGSALSRSVFAISSTAVSFAVRTPVPVMPGRRDRFRLHIVRDNQLTH